MGTKFSSSGVTVTIMSFLKFILAFAILTGTRGDPFFGNNFLIPQSVELASYANAVVTSLNSARNSVSSYTRLPPTSSASLSAGAITLQQYVGNVSQLVGGAYTELARAASDRTSAPAIVFTKISTQFAALKPLIQNSSLYIEDLARSFDYEGDSSVSNYFADRNERIRVNSHNLQVILQNVSAVIESIAGQGLNTQQFLAALSANGLLQQLLDAGQGAATASAEFADVVAQLAAAITQANNFRVTSNLRIQQSRTATNTAVNNYITSSNASFNSILTTTDSLFNHLKTLNDSFVFRWPLLLSDPVEQKLDLLNRSIENLIVNLHYRRQVVESHFISTREVFQDANEPQQYLALEAELLTRRLVNVIKPSACVVNFRTQFHALPATVQTVLTQCINSQLGLERSGASQVVSIANGFLRSYATEVYAGLEICFRHPFASMNECLEAIVAQIDFSGKFFLLDTLSSYLYEQVQSELFNCNSRLLQYIQNRGLRANCP
ncbi:uncharacterized protein LOC120419056 [Culex pipiens pallens]|uniref:uncharacterized protein LOC120419056 n=1 Tax=Culex pipiens pallens TaxID=42434 RepID=UPI0019536FA6|nr:uncharacterized protein LOC120419056 [Culex pipiens pallens]